jgi:hypothetical protein
MKVTGANQMPSYGALTPISYFIDMIDGLRTSALLLYITLLIKKKKNRHG